MSEEVLDHSLPSSRAPSRLDISRPSTRGLTAAGSTANLLDTARDPKTERPMIPPQLPPVDSIRPRWLLTLQAWMWRFLMQIGMFLHKCASPIPPRPQFARLIPTTISPSKGKVQIHFYVPKDYQNRKLRQGDKFPVVVNFHGGGFTLGCALDDARWAAAVVEDVGAVVASVDYRRAPEHPFPTAVEDGVDALIYIAKHAEELHLDMNKIAVSGFSSGGNMAFTVPLRLQEEVWPEANTETYTELSLVKASDHPGDTKTVVTMLRNIKIAAICSWYPSVDYTRTRAQRRATTVRKDQNISATFTELFDQSYLSPPSMDMRSPYLSPGVATTDMLNHLPENILLFTCEYDMLLDEAEIMRTRLADMGKNIFYRMVKGVPHGFDKAPNPFKSDPAVRESYREACEQLRKVFLADKDVPGSSRVISEDASAPVH